MRTDSQQSSEIDDMFIILVKKLEMDERYQSAKQLNSKITDSLQGKPVTNTCKNLTPAAGEIPMKVIRKPTKDFTYRFRPNDLKELNNVMCKVRSFLK